MPPPLELLPSSVGQLSSVTSGIQWLAADDARNRNYFLSPSAPSVPQPTALLPAGPRSRPWFLPLSPDRIGSIPQLGGPAYPHHRLLDPVGFQGSCFPGSRHYFMTGTSPDAATQPAGGRLLRCAPSPPSLSTEGPLHPGSLRLEEVV